MNLVNTVALVANVFRAVAVGIDNRAPFATMRVIVLGGVTERTSFLRE